MTTQRVPNVMDVWDTLGSRCTNVMGHFGTRWVVIVKTSLVHWEGAFFVSYIPVSLVMHIIVFFFLAVIRNQTVLTGMICLLIFLMVYSYSHNLRDYFSGR